MDAVDEALLIFVYGTLRRKCSSGAHTRFLSRAIFLGEARLQAKLFRVSYYPAIILTDENFQVTGEVYALQDAHDLQQLDEYEACALPAHPDHEYRRERVTLVLPGTPQPVCAWTYVYNQPTDHLEQIPGGDFLAE